MYMHIQAMDMNIQKKYPPVHPVAVHKLAIVHPQVVTNHPILTNHQAVHHNIMHQLQNQVLKVVIHNHQTNNHLQLLAEAIQIIM